MSRHSLEMHKIQEQLDCWIHQDDVDTGLQVRFAPQAALAAPPQGAFQWAKARVPALPDRATYVCPDKDIHACPAS